MFANCEVNSAQKRSFSGPNPNFISQIATLRIFSSQIGTFFDNTRYSYITMRYAYFLFFLSLATQVFSADNTFTGTWEGVLFKAGQPMEKGTVLYAEFNIQDGILTGSMREEAYNTDYFGLKQVTGTVQNGKLLFNQIVVENNKTAYRSKWCLQKGTLTYDSITGYLTGDFESTDCGRLIGKIILYRADFVLSKSEESQSSHIWFEPFIKDYKDGLSAPEIRKKERENFVFEPIFFDFDEAIIREEHKAFLDRMIKVIKGHSDLRVLVTGHTDAEGTNGYNDALSKRRAEAIVAYFTEHGLDKDRLEFDFKGENLPVASNETPEGRQRNRRVDFSFLYSKTSP